MQGLGGSSATRFLGASILQTLLLSGRDKAARRVFDKHFQEKLSLMEWFFCAPRVCLHFLWARPFRCESVPWAPFGPERAAQLIRGCWAEFRGGALVECPFHYFLSQRQSLQLWMCIRFLWKVSRAYLGQNRSFFHSCCSSTTWWQMFAQQTWQTPETPKGLSDLVCGPFRILKCVDF